ncbi:SDR family oxidoreductase [Azotosporobacter soli]|uniref:SDR family oxidoreductase n=1 Tax=Azotosporobacter soli TaxID=3055040 RepID=UPI0031FF36ED
MKTLVTGATGKLGSKVVAELLKKLRPSELAVSVRTPEKAAHLKALGVDVRQADFDQPETLTRAFSGIDKLLLISADGDNETRIRQHANAVAAAKQAQVKFIAYTSVGNASESSLFLAPVHKLTEEAIRKTGIPFSFLRNNWYLENETGTIQAVLAGAPWLTAAKDGKVGWALQQDYAEAAAAVLLGSEHENSVYELSGKPLTQEELAAALGEVLQKDVPVKQVDDATYAEIMGQVGVPDFVVPILVEIQRAIRAGALDLPRSDFEALLGRPLTPLNQGLSQIVEGLAKK